MSENISIVSGGDEFKGWENISISRSLDALSGSFSAETYVSWGVDNRPFGLKTDLEVEVHINDEHRVLTGFIDSTSSAADINGQTFSIAGRDKTAMLADSMIDKTAPFLFENWDRLISGLKIKERLGIDTTLRFNTEYLRRPVSGGLQKMTVAPGETYFDVLAKKAKRDGLTLTTNGLGALIVTAGNSIKGRRSLREGENIKTSSVTVDSTDRFSKYVIYGQTDPASWGTTTREPELGQSLDANGRSGKVYVDIDQNISTTNELKQRADWENTVRSARSEKINCTVAGFISNRELGEIWAPNQLVVVNIPSSSISGYFIITKCTYSISRSAGPETSITLERDGAREINPTKPTDVVESAW